MKGIKLALLALLFVSFGALNAASMFFYASDNEEDLIRNSLSKITISELGHVIFSGTGAEFIDEMKMGTLGRIFSKSYLSKNPRRPLKYSIIWNKGPLININGSTMTKLNFTFGIMEGKLSLQIST